MSDTRMSGQIVRVLWIGRSASCSGSSPGRGQWDWDLGYLEVVAIVRCMWSVTMFRWVVHVRGHPHEHQDPRVPSKTLQGNEMMLFTLHVCPVDDSG